VRQVGDQRTGSRFMLWELAASVDSCLMDVEGRPPETASRRPGEERAKKPGAVRSFLRRVTDLVGTIPLNSATLLWDNTRKDERTRRQRRH